MSKITLNSIINVDRIRSDSPNFFEFVASYEERQSLTARFQFLGVLSLSAEITIFKSSHDCWDVAGQLIGDVVQACRVTGAPLTERVDFLVEERYVRGSSSLDEVEVCLDKAEPLENGAINIGELVAQSLAIAVKPWPRVLEAPETYTSGNELPDHPFDGLAALKRQLSK